VKLGICTIQRDRSQWLVEWLAFHYVVGFRKFYFYAHRCIDDTCEKIKKLSSVLDIKLFDVQLGGDFVQLKAYQANYNTFGHEVDWMAFIDGDEFLFPTRADCLQDVLEAYRYQKLSALAVYWVIFGSNGHLKEPNGLIIDNYVKRPSYDIIYNHHIKSIVLGRQMLLADKNAHIFTTPFGTFDELMRPIDRGFMTDLVPSYQHLRINHYICQSRSYFVNFKNLSGMPDTASPDLPRGEEFWSERNINDVYDNDIHRFRCKVIKKMNELEEAIQRDWN